MTNKFLFGFIPEFFLFLQLKYSDCSPPYLLIFKSDSNFGFADVTFAGLEKIARYLSFEHGSAGFEYLRCYSELKAPHSHAVN